MTDDDNIIDDMEDTDSPYYPWFEERGVRGGCGRKADDVFAAGYGCMCILAVALMGLVVVLLKGCG